MKNLIYKTLLLSLILLTNLPNAFGAASECLLIGGGTFTASGQTSSYSLPRYVRRSVFVTQITAVSGTTPTLTVNYQHAYLKTATFATVVSTSSLSTVSITNTMPVTNGVSATLLPFMRADYVIGGVTPSFTVNFYICYDEEY